MTTLVNEGLIEEDTLDIEEVLVNRRLTSVFIHGHVHCSNGVIVRVDKELAVQRNKSGHLYVKGSDYSYHAWLSATGQEILRYDMAHASARLHRHLFDPTTGQEQITDIELDELPTLDAFIRLAIARAKDF
jgi:hypothetical protein